MNIKGMIKTAVVVLAVMAIVNRVEPLRNIVEGN